MAHHRRCRRRAGRLCVSLDELEAKIAEQSRSLRNPPANAVVLSTVHSAKRLEWDTVFVVGVEDGVLPHVNAEDHEEERRIAYVAMTRARRRLGLTYAGERYGDHSRPSPFLFQIAGSDKRSCIWTGPRLGGADDRLPLATPAELLPPCLARAEQCGSWARRARPDGRKPSESGNGRRQADGAAD